MSFLFVFLVPTKHSNCSDDETHTQIVIGPERERVRRRKNVEKYHCASSTTSTCVVYVCAKSVVEVVDVELWHFLCRSRSLYPRRRMVTVHV
jgi:hypothetical protein